jgi:hypothetical protein
MQKQKDLNFTNESKKKINNLIREDLDKKF